MILIDATTMWQCETCYWHGNTGCASFIWCENGESYRPSMDKLKQVEAEPVRHGHWIEKELFIPWCDDDVDIIYECSCCGTGVGPSPYCPNCGAKMDEVSE